MGTEKEVKAAPLVSMLFWTRTKAGGEPPVEPAPMPVSLAVCGLPLALSLTASVAVRVPAAVGVNVTLIAQAAPPGGTDTPQLLVCAKSPLFVPMIAMLEMLRLTFPVFESVTIWEALVVPTFWLLKLKEDGVSVTIAAVPVPPRASFCGLPPALSVMYSDEPRVPVASWGRHQYLFRFSNG